MDNKNIDKLTSIQFPNNVENQRRYKKDEHTTFQGIMKSGEMAGIQWIQVYKDNVLIAEIKESICDLYYN
jgi:hypothetical protein